MASSKVGKPVRKFFILPKSAFVKMKHNPTFSRYPSWNTCMAYCTVSASGVGLAHQLHDFGKTRAGPEGTFFFNVSSSEDGSSLGILSSLPGGELVALRGKLSIPPWCNGCTTSVLPIRVVFRV